MKKVCTFLAVSCLSVALIHAQTIADDFNDNSRDPAIWLDPFVDGGDGQLSEQNGRVEFSAAGALGETDVSQALRRFPTYNQAWQVQAVVSMSKDNFSTLGEVGTVSIDVGSGDNWLGMGYGAGVLSPGPSVTALVSGWAVGAGDANNITLLALPSAIGIRIAYDPQRRLIRAYYDLDADMNDGEWTLYDSFTIDGSPNPIGTVSLDWGMTAIDNFYFVIDGFSSGPAIAAGSAWADDFEYIPGRMLPTPTVADNFDDNSRDAVIWEAPIPDPTFGSGEILSETGGRLEFTSPVATESWASQSVKAFPGYDQAWQVQMLVSVAESGFGANQLGYMGIEVGGTGAGDKSIDVGMAAGNAPELGSFPFREAIFSGGYDPVLTEDGGFLNFFKEELPPAIGIRMTYDPNTRIVRIYYDLDADNTDGEWTLFQSYTIDGSTVPGAQVLDWGMTGSDSFSLGVYGGAEGNVAVASGTEWADDFEFNLDSTARSTSGPSFADDFNDDSRDPLWELPSVDLGSPVLVDENHRLELRVASAAGEQELVLALTPGFWPQFNQAFEVKVEAHSLPAAMTTEGQVAVAELAIANASGTGDVILSAGAMFTGGSRQQVVAADNSKVDPLNDNPEVLTLGVLPDVVGIRIVWNPDTKTVSCYFDTDGDRTVETWALVVDYTLDGVDRGAAHVSDWQMAPTDRFLIELSGFADSTIVASGEAYFENFSFISAVVAPVLAGYDLWAATIPDAGMRATTDDASGNGIVNLLQYMYGLEPMAPDTDVKFTISLEGGVPALRHGLNETATDYVFSYQQKSALGNVWVDGADGEATLIETIQSNGKTLRKLTLPLNPGNTFFHLEVVPQF